MRGSADLELFTATANDLLSQTIVGDPIIETPE